MRFESVVVNGIALHRLEGKLRCGFTDQIVRTTAFLLGNRRTRARGHRLTRNQGIELAFDALFEIAKVTHVDGFDFSALAEHDHGRESSGVKQRPNFVVRIVG